MERDTDEEREAEEGAVIGLTEAEEEREEDEDEEEEAEEWEKEHEDEEERAEELTAGLTGREPGPFCFEVKKVDSERNNTRKVSQHVPE